MYTQCPDCGTSFRVTAVVLKQAAGKVRCGGCGNAFNALAYLSEDKPDRTTRTDADGSLPELVPDDAEALVDGPPAAISPEQSAALLKTLDQLAGEDIRLEDTGVEWRVVGSDDEVDISRVDDLLQKTPTHVDEFLTKTPTAVEAGEIFEDADAAKIDALEVFEAAEETGAEELRFDDNTGLPDDFNVNELPTPPSKAKPEPEPEPEPENAQVDLGLGDPDEWGDLLDEVEEVEDVEEPEEIEEVKEVAAAQEIDDAEETAEEPLDIDTQFDLQAEAMGIYLSGVHEELEEEEEDEDADAEDLIVDFEETAEIDLDEELDGDYDEDIENLEIRLDNEIEAQADEVDTSDSISEHYVPPQSEEEQTINMLIDRDLFDLAIEDEDGFASTIVIENKNIEKKELGETTEDEPNLKETAAGFETIIMEGASVRAAGNGLANADFVLAKEVVQEEPKLNASKYSMIAGIVVLALLLIGQIVHQSRAALATVPAIGEALAPVYRAIGAPISPDWDISGWRFEVTKGSTNPIAELVNGESELTDVDAVDDSADLLTAEDETLTIYSRIGNNSDGPLPYPLISVALTDRFEEIIGSKVLEPNAYLTGNFDPRIAVLPGETFNAVISIESPSPEVTGFKLNVCYRQAGGLLRCAMEDFK